MSTRLYNILNAIVAPFGKTLWTGNWSSGTKTIDGSDKYVAYIVNMNGTPCFGLRSGTYVQISSMAGSTTSGSGQQYIKVGRFSVSGNTWTLDYLKQANHNDTGSTAHTLSTMSMWVSEIVGLIPKWGG